MCEAIRGAIQTHAWEVKGHPLICTLDQEPWKKERNRAMTKAEEALREVATDHQLETHKDCAGGALWLVRPRELQLGHFDRRAGWLWCATALESMGWSLEALTLAVKSER